MKARVEVAITRVFLAEHSLPCIGVAQRHKHSFSVECGYLSQTDPALGCERPMQALARDVEAVLSRLEGQYLNEAVPVPPTAEMLACWILAQLPPYWEWVSIRAYDGFACKVARKDLSLGIDELRPPHRRE